MPDIAKKEVKDKILIAETLQITWEISIEVDEQDSGNLFGEDALNRVDDNSDDRRRSSPMSVERYPEVVGIAQAVVPGEDQLHVALVRKWRLVVEGVQLFNDLRKHN